MKVESGKQGAWGKCALHLLLGAALLAAPAGALGRNRVTIYLDGTNADGYMVNNDNYIIRHFSKFILPRNWLPRPYPGLPPYPSGIFEQFVFACVNL
ncbi:MAG: hypothetical protein LBT98_04390, partial [Puniceicoccales bacterium]|nr:hypothetical protein [Puniceicoccales bacterium]